MTRIAMSALVLGVLLLTGCRVGRQVQGSDGTSLGGDGSGIQRDGPRRKDLPVTTKHDRSVPFPVPDRRPPWKDVFAHKPDLSGIGCTTPFAAKVNSGKSCTADPGACSPDELCMSGFKNASGQNVAMCLGRCCPNLANPSDPVNRCPTADPLTMVSLCALGLAGRSDMTCAYVCEVQQGSQTVEFDCPDSVSYDCVDIGEPGVKLCVPKT